MVVRSGQLGAPYKPQELVHGMLSLVSDVTAPSVAGFERFITWAFAGLTVLAAYQLAFFFLVAAAIIGSVPVPLINVWAICIALVVGAVGLLGLVPGISGRLGLRTRAGQRVLPRLQVVLAGTAGILSIVGYALAPGGDLYDKREALGVWNVASLTVVGTSIFFGFVFMSASVWQLVNRTQVPTGSN